MMLFQSLLTLILIILILWRKNSHNAFFWGMSFQWLSVNIKIFYGLYVGLNLEDLVDHPDHIYEANIYSNIGLIIMCLGIYVLTKKIKYPDPQSFDWSKYKQFDKVYIYYSLFFLFATPFSYNAALQQIFVYLTLIKFSLLFIALNQSLATKKKFTDLIYLVILFEIILSLTGFFSGFKDYLFVLLYTLVYQQSNNLKLSNIIKLTPLIVLLFYLGIIWSSVKVEYRSYISEGEAVQSNNVGASASLNKLSDLVGNLNQDQFNIGFESLINRMSYIEFFSATINYVPLYEPHTYGERLFSSITYGLQPRIFFPNKPITDYSEVTTKYTGIFVTGKENATSISLGYMADAYIDFGKYFFWITPLVIGLMMGYSYIYLYKIAPSPIWSVAITFPFYYISNFYGFDSLKVIPPILYYTLVAYLFLKYLVPIVEKMAFLDD